MLLSQYRQHLCADLRKLRLGNNAELTTLCRHGIDWSGTDQQPAPGQVAAM
jgi:hypothetical protein